MKENLGSITFIIAIVIIIGALAVFYQGQILTKYNTKEIDAFIETSFEYLNKEIGAPEYSIEQVIVIVRPGDTNARSGFIDSEGGIFYISLPDAPNTKPKWQTYGAIAHEAMHIYRKSIGDPCMEGLCDLFACTMLEKAGLESKLWDEYLSNTDKFPFYRETYLMMKELKSIVKDDGLNRLFANVKEYNAISQRHFDLNAWLDSLPADQKIRVRAVLDSHKQKVRELMPPVPPLVFDYE